MTSPIDPTRPAAPTVREIAALTARLRNISARGRDVDPDERAAFLADKDALIARITDTPADSVEDGARDDAEDGARNSADGGWLAQARPADPDTEVITFEQSGYYSDADLAAISDAIAAGDTERARQLQDRPWTAETTDAAWPVMPDWMREQAARAEAELANRDTEGDGAGDAERADDPVEIAERVGHLRAEYGPTPVEATITRADAAQRLTDLGHDPASAQAMVAEYLHETSRAVGVPVYQWGLDGHDVAAIAAQYAWVRDGNGQTLAQARHRAGGYAQYWTEQAAALDPEHHPRETEQVQRLVDQWADRARTPEPFTHPATDGDIAEDTLTDRETAAPAIGDEQRTGTEHNAAAVDDEPTVFPPREDSRAETEQPETSPRAAGAAADRSGGGHVAIPEQDRREQLARWHADDHTTAETTGEDTATAGSVDGASLDLGRG